MTIAIIVAFVVRSVRDQRDPGRSSTTAPTAPTSSITKVLGLAAAECEEGTFVVWKAENGHFYWKGTLASGTWEADSADIPVTKVNTILAYGVPVASYVNMTATCWRHDEYRIVCFRILQSKKGILI